MKNFISNSIKYINPNISPNELSIHIQTTDLQVFIKIKDNGLGIDADYLPRIFDMFFRATDKSEGSGLGLYIVKQTIEQLKGKVEVKSIKGEGTEILLTLPNVKE